jgi:hypothetical protein
MSNMNEDNVSNESSLNIDSSTSVSAEACTSQTAESFNVQEKNYPASNAASAFAIPNEMKDEIEVGDHSVRGFSEKTANTAKNIFSWGAPSVDGETDKGKKNDGDKSPFQQVYSEPLERQLAKYSTKEIERRRKRAMDRTVILDKQRASSHVIELDLIENQQNLILNSPQDRLEKRQREQISAENAARDEERDKLEDSILEFDKELEIRINNSQIGLNSKGEPTSLIAPEFIFKEDSPIQNAVLYTATFFPYLSISEFKRVVSSLLKDQTQEKKSVDREIIEDGKQKIFSTLIQKNLVASWEEDPCEQDNIFARCHLELKNDSTSQYVDFSESYLRDSCREYFQRRRFSYAGRMLTYVEDLLFFDPSKKVSDMAASLMSEVMVYESDKYNGDWLIDIVRQVKEGEKKPIYIEKIVRLIYYIQVGLDIEKSRKFLREFLVGIVDIDIDATFEIVSKLLYIHLSSGLLEINRIESIDLLLDWLKEKLNETFNDSASSDPEQENLCKSLSTVYRLLWCEELQQVGDKNYFYDLLRGLEKWLPSTEFSPEKYCPSHEIALIILLVYSKETIIASVGSNKYSTYPIFNPIEGDPYSKKNIANLRLLVRYLFYPFTDLSDRYEELNFQLSDTLEYFEIGMDITFVSSILLEWFSIIFEFNPSKISSHEKSQLADALLRQVVSVTDKHKQRELSESWAKFSDYYLDQAEDLEGDNRKKFIARRKLVKEIRKRFTAQKKIHAEEIQENV